MVITSCLEDDVVMSEEDESAVIDHWPEMPFPNPPQTSLTPQHGLQMGAASTTNKRHVDASSGSSDSANVECLPQLATIAKFTTGYSSGC